MSITYTEITTQDIVSVSKDMKDKKVLLIGDLCLDSYYFCDPHSDERSVETGQLIEQALHTSTSLGGLGNVATHLHALGVSHISVCGMLGTDMEGMQIQKLLAELEVDSSLLYVEAETQTSTYSKFIKNNQEILRIDKGKVQNPSLEKIDYYIRALSSKIRSYDFIIINQQLPQGFISELFLTKILQVLQEQTIHNVIIDTRDYPHLCGDFDLKVNDFELCKLMGDQYTPLDSIPFAKTRKHLTLRSETSQGTTICTLGERGACFQQGNEMIYARALNVFPPIDTVGAGDSFVAGYSIGLMAGLDKGQAMALGNAVSRVTITQVHTTGSVSYKEIKEVVESSGYVYNIAYDTQTTLTDVIEIIVSPTQQQRFKVAVFDFDGTLSVLREGWQDIMHETLTTIVHEKRPHHSIDSIHTEMEDLIDKTTGIQTITQMELFRNILSLKYGCEAHELLDAIDYKHRYITHLEHNVAHRTHQIAQGLLSQEDFRIKGAYEMLSALREQGVTLYLASGTDHANVVEEVEVLGLTEFFEDRIQGSVNDMKNDPKKKVLHAIMKNISGDVVIFGDGPVELREGRRMGAYCCGVVSDERRRYGWNLSKKQRLVKAGAHMLVPDFSHYKEIITILRT